ncbi:UNVERIFIED_CONTAM: hypothetical protein Scaly_2731400 [Sesamum calycinum]|uniref:Uncharacterized protein n=1 Tax=Sesamum calycinum TaxID=2727403 RepID=A0AAW2J308_9LAMI
MSNDVQKQYDRSDDVTSILQRMKEVYAIPDRHTRYVATKEFFKAKMTEGSSLQEHRVKMLSIVEKLEDLKVGLDNDTYINVILQSLPLFYDPFIVNFNMNRHEKSINELINMLVQYEATIKKSVPSVLIRETSTSKVKGKRAGRWKKKKSKANAKTVIVAKDATSAPVAPVGMGQGKRKIGMFVVEVNIVTNSASKVLDTSCGAHICNNLQVLRRSRKLSKDEVVLRLGDGKAVAEAARGGFSYFITLTNDDSWYGYVYLMSGPDAPYQIWHNKPASYKYLRVWDSPAYVKRPVGDKLDSRSSLCRFISYPKETASEAPQSNAGTSSAPTVSTDNVPILRSQLECHNLLRAMKSEMNSMSSNQVWTLVDRPKGVKSIGCKWVYKCKTGADGEVTTFKPAWYDYEIWQMDVTTPFLNSFVEEEIYMDQPEGFTVSYGAIISLRTTLTLVYTRRHDIAYALRVTSKHQACAADVHWTTVKTILKCLRRTKDVLLVYDGREFILEGFSNSNFQSDDDDAKSQSRFVFKLNGGVVAWKSSKQDTTVDSTTEGEYIAALEAAKEAFSIKKKNYIQELGVGPSCRASSYLQIITTGLQRKQRNRDFITDPNIFLNDTIYSERWWKELTFGWSESV